MKILVLNQLAHKYSLFCLSGPRSAAPMSNDSHTEKNSFIQRHLCDDLQPVRLRCTVLDYCH